MGDLWSTRGWAHGNVFSVAKTTLTEEEINRQARAGETGSAVNARLTGTSVAEFAKPGETFDQVLERKRKSAEVKKKLR
jgi:hypothetical protein